ncbi:MAG: hypothetical protein AB8H86_12600 [Polyangiales bacterium]
MGTKRRLKKLEKAVSRLPQEKALIDRIVELSAQRVEEKVREQLRDATERIVSQVGDELDRRLPREADVRGLLAEVMREVMQSPR